MVEKVESTNRFIIRFYNIATETVVEWWTKPMTPLEIGDKFRVVENSGAPTTIDGGLKEYAGNTEIWDTLSLTPELLRNPNMLISWGIKRKDGDKR